MGIAEIKEMLWLYILTLYHDIPSYVYEGLLSVFCIGAVVLVLWKGRKSARLVSRLLLVEYTFLIYCSTFFFRETQPFRLYKLDLFWHFNAPYLIPEIIMNIVVFVPLGFLIASQRCGWLVTIVTGFLMSVSIEMLQFAFKCGSCDVDDIINNTLGAMIGATLWLVAKGLWLKNRGKRLF